jgi:hypothetical protein
LRLLALLVGISIALSCESCAALRPAAPVDLYDLPCEPGYQESTMAKTDGPVAPELQRVAHTKLCTANPQICRSNTECQKNYECNFHTESFVPQGAGVCWPNVDAVLGSEN